MDGRPGGSTEGERVMSADNGPGVTDSPAARLQTLFEGHRLTPTQRRIAHSMVRRAADVPFLSSVELAELAGVSQPSVTRFAVALGFDGYPALRRHLRDVGPAEPAPDTTAYNEYQQAVEAEIENLRHLAEVLADPAPVARAGRL
ncbi:MurR/RpiR family transcriptional regulator, partial [Streptomyces caniscabiei]|uniref:MurR/RpiR family transcriptional regulator n=1 Tax=Streptomyces caniscabiei TaxID=2746961 RepID=UPI003B9829FD